MSIIALLISSITPPSLLYHYSNSAHKNDLSSDSNLIVSKAQSLRLKVGQRQRLNSDYGIWFLTKDEDGLIYAACVSEDYPQRVVFGLFQKMQVSLKQKSDGNQLSKVVNKLKNQFNQLCQKYKDARLDKMKTAHFTVKDLKDELYIGIGKKTENLEKLKTFKQKSTRIKSFAKQFQKGGEEVEEKVFWHKWKVFIMMGVVIANVLIVSGIIIYFNIH